MDFIDEKKAEKPCQENLLFVDIQGFKTYRERFMCKEFCMVSIADEDDDWYHALIKAPYPYRKMSAFYKKQAKWLYKHCHGLEYGCGDVHLLSVIEDTYTKLMDKVVIVKGQEKVKWLKHMFRNCGEIKCLNFDDLYLGDEEVCLENMKAENICNYHLNKNLKRFIKRCKENLDLPNFQCAVSTALKMREAVKKSNFSY